MQTAPEAWPEGRSVLPHSRPGLMPTPIHDPAVSHTAPGAGSSAPASPSTNCRPHTATSERSAPRLGADKFKNSAAHRAARRPHSVRICSNCKTVVPSRERVVLLWPAAERPVVIQADRPWRQGVSPFSGFWGAQPVTGITKRDRHMVVRPIISLSARSWSTPRAVTHPVAGTTSTKKFLKARPLREPKRALASPQPETAAHEKTETLRTIQPHAAHAPAQAKAPSPTRTQPPHEYEPKQARVTRHHPPSTSDPLRPSHLSKETAGAA